MTNPIRKFVDQQGVLVLDGGLATEFEARGWQLDDQLWSARLLMEAPDEIRQVHLDYLLAGADCITTATYQASLPGFLSRGMTEIEAMDLLRLSVALAVEARDAFWADDANVPGRVMPLVAASVGPYGAYLADGSEYSGRYSIDDAGLYEFHHSRWIVLANSAADVLACETIPSVRETEVILKLLEETKGAWAWMSFSCLDGRQISDGTPIEEVVSVCNNSPQVAAIGVNCTAPEHISELIDRIARSTDKPIVVYPNSGERYDPRRRAWVAAAHAVDWGAAAEAWRRSGAVCIGGCCRVGPRDIATMRKRLLATKGGRAPF